MRRAASSRRAVIAALIGNFVIAVTKFIAAAMTGSSAMMSEGLHSVVDTSNEALLLYGLHRAKKPPDDEHPLGFGRELYFYSFIVALLIFSLGAVASLYEGVRHILSPSPITDVRISYIVLGVSFIFESVSWWFGLRAFRRTQGDLGYLEALHESKDPASFIVVLEDSAAILGLAAAAAGITAAHFTGIHEFDGAGSLGVGLILAVTAIILARETKSLLIGEQAKPTLRRAILSLAREEECVLAADQLITVQLAPRQVVAALHMEFAPGTSARAVKHCMADLKARLNEQRPEVVALLLWP